MTESSDIFPECHLFFIFPTYTLDILMNTVFIIFTINCQPSYSKKEVFSIFRKHSFLWYTLFYFMNNFYYALTFCTETFNPYPATESD